MAMNGTTEIASSPEGCILPSKALKGHRASESTRTAGFPQKSTNNDRLTAVLVYCVAFTHRPLLIASYSMHQKIFSVTLDSGCKP